MKILPTLIIFSVFVFFSCSNSTTKNDADTDDTIIPDETADKDTVNDEPVSDEDTIIDGLELGEPVAGMVSILGGGYDGATSSGYVTAAFYDSPVHFDAFSTYPDLHAQKAKVGKCAIYIAENSACNPACDFDEYCSKDSKCKKAPVMISAGKVSISSGNKSFDLTYDEYFGYYSENEISGMSSQPEISINAEGDKVETFGSSIKTPPLTPVNIKNYEVALYDDKDTEITWEKSGNVGEIIYVVFNFGWHGAPPEAVILCAAPDSDGSITISKEISKLAPLNGGAGLEPHGSYVMRINRTFYEECYTVGNGRPHGSYVMRINRTVLNSNYGKILLRSGFNFYVNVKHE